MCFVLSSEPDIEGMCELPECKWEDGHLQLNIVALSVSLAKKKKTLLEILRTLPKLDIQVKKFAVDI